MNPIHLLLMKDEALSRCVQSAGPPPQMPYVGTILALQGRIDVLLQTLRVQQLRAVCLICSLHGRLPLMQCCVCAAGLQALSAVSERGV